MSTLGGSRSRYRQRLGYLQPSPLEGPGVSCASRSSFEFGMQSLAGARPCIRAGNQAVAANLVVASPGL
jgi:hypothetical protein